jgi:hypothetical protein
VKRISILDAGWERQEAEKREVERQEAKRQKEKN